MPKKADIPEDVFFNDAETPATQDDSKKAKGQKRKRTPASYRRVTRPEPEPPAEPPKVPVTMYLTEAVANRLEEVKYLLLMEHGVRTNKSAIANYALRVALEEMDAVARAMGGTAGNGETAGNG